MYDVFVHNVRKTKTRKMKKKCHHGNNFQFKFWKPLPDIFVKCSFNSKFSVFRSIPLKSWIVPAQSLRNQNTNKEKNIIAWQQVTKWIFTNKKLTKEYNTSVFSNVIPSGRTRTITAIFAPSGTRLINESLRKDPILQIRDLGMVSSDNLFFFT